METKLAIYAAALVLGVGLLATTYAHAAFALDQSATSSADNSGSNSADQSSSQSATGGTATADSSGSSGDTKASADVKQSSDQDIKQKIVTVSKIKQKADCSGNSGGSGSSNGNFCPSPPR